MPIVVTLVGMITDASDVQPSKADSPIVVTLFGMITDTSDVQPPNAHLPITVTDGSRVTCVTFLEQQVHHLGHVRIAAYASPLFEPPFHTFTFYD